MTALSDLRAAVTRADKVLGCGRAECLYCSVDDGFPGRCVCHARFGRETMEALYKAAKAVVEEDEDRADIEVAEKRLDEINLEPSFVIRMTPENWAKFEAICNDPSEPTEALKALWQGKAGEFEFDDTLKTCWCFRCLDEPSMGPLNPAFNRMIVCPDCGSKRCPRTTWHINKCSGSNEPDQ